MNIADQLVDYEAQRLVWALLTEALAGARKLCHFIDHGLKRTKGASSDEAMQLELVAHQLAQFWKDVMLARMAGRVAHGAADESTCVGKVLWGLIQATRKIQKYRAVQFTHHPNMSSALINWLLTHSPSKQISKLEKDLTTLTTKVTKLQGQIDGLITWKKVAERKLPH